MEFWSKGLGKKTIAMGLTKGESTVSTDALCLKGVMEEPIPWEYVMLMDEDDLVDFFALLQEPAFASYVHRSPNRWKIYASFALGALQIAWLAITGVLGRAFGSGAAEERVVVELPPPYVIKDKKKKKRAYKRRLSTTALLAPTHTYEPSEEVPAAGQLRAGHA